MAIIYTDKDLPKRHKNDEYITPQGLCNAVMSKLSMYTEPDLIIDPGCGSGNWGRACREIYGDKPYILGIDIQDLKEYDLSHYSGVITNADYRTFDMDINPESSVLIVGNPPYKYAEEFIIRSLNVIPKYCYVAFLFKLVILETRGRYNRLYSKGLNPWQVWVSTRRVNFENSGSSNPDAFAMYIRNNSYRGKTVLDWIDWEYE